MNPPVEPSDSRAVKVLRAVLWRRQDRPGAEYCELRAVAEGWELAGAVVLADGAAPALVRYWVVCDGQWATRGARISLVRDGVARELLLRVDAERRWWDGERELVQVRGCVDVDLAFTPSTNTPPIRRLGLEVGQGRDVTAAWVRFPDLTVEPLPQRYERLGETRYRYQSRGGAFTAELETDDLGLVKDYPPAWRR